ncbi:hypothetical protein RHODGE_RHODGE_01060 [Rhodoplanes serenus]|uniref:Tetratricopeptide repeat protein n=1 Tax=Rhodoplanes serenus TaxID=200615 RepID=A0A447CRU3_9BRAD|nr:hypothetical protein [Rhodoplanes serenus]VCU07910.1 hypothetical protein RHODGE_RHODGE_01060 [Rhodoplanes serenus]
MTATVDAPEAEWLLDLRADPGEAVRRLVAGSARFGRLAAAEPEDAAATLLHDAEPDIREAFGRGCLALLKSFRGTMLSLDRAAFTTALGRLAVLVAVVRRTTPRDTVVDLHRNYIAWNAFFETFVVDRGLDLRREYWRILALTQQEAEDAGLAHRRLMPLWLAVCGESGGSGQYDESYLRVALLGLRRLPLGAALSSNEDFVLHGLARWAAWRNPQKRDFLRQWHVLKGDYPHGADFWPARVEATIAATERELSERTKETAAAQETFPAAAWWREDVGAPARPITMKRRPSRAAEPPARERREEILRRVDQPLDGFRTTLDRLVADHRAYADATGDVFYLVRTACNIGMRLIERGPPEERTARGETAVRLAALSFEYSPIDPFPWGLLLRGLQTADRAGDAELVGWESIRRFPEDPHRRTQLATVLAEPLDRPWDAVPLLRDAIRLFPDNAQAPTQLAKLLADRLGRRDEALEVLRTAQHAGAADDLTTSLLHRLQRSRPRGAAPAPPPAARPAAASSTLDLPTAAARRVLFRFEQGLSRLDDVKALLDHHSPDAYLAYVGERTMARPAPVATTFALAFEAAARTGSTEALRALIRRARSLDGVLAGQAIAAMEGRVEPFPLDQIGTGGAARLRLLVDHFANTNAPAPPQRLLLLRDMAASFLSTDMAFPARLLPAA